MKGPHTKGFYNFQCTKLTQSQILACSIEEQLHVINTITYFSWDTSEISHSLDSRLEFLDPVVQQALILLWWGALLVSLCLCSEYGNAYSNINTHSELSNNMFTRYEQPSVTHHRCHQIPEFVN